MLLFYTTIGLCKGFYASFYLKISKMVFNTMAASIAAGIKVIKVIDVFKILSAPRATHMRKEKRVDAPNGFDASILLRYVSALLDGDLHFRAHAP